MVITFIQRKKTQKYLVLVFGILIAAIAFVFLSQYLGEEEVLVEKPLGSEYLPKIKIDFQVLENPILQNLSEPFPELPPPLPSGEFGRENPFLPYEKKAPEETPPQ